VAKEATKERLQRWRLSRVVASNSGHQRLSLSSECGGGAKAWRRLACHHPVGADTRTRLVGHATPCETAGPLQQWPCTTHGIEYMEGRECEWSQGMMLP